MGKTIVAYRSIKVDAPAPEHVRAMRRTPEGLEVPRLATACCWHCDKPIGRARAVTATTELENPSDMTVVWHARCFGAWRRSQAFKRGRGPRAVEVRHG